MIETPLEKLAKRLVRKGEFDYLSIVGPLLHFLSCVRCDIAYAAGVLTRHSACPGPAHVRATKRVAMYLYSNRTLGITYRRQDQRKRPNIPQLFEGAKHPLDDGRNLLQTFADSD